MSVSTDKTHFVCVVDTLYAVTQTIDAFIVFVDCVHIGNLIGRVVSDADSVKRGKSHFERCGFGAYECAFAGHIEHGSHDLHSVHVNEFVLDGVFARQNDVVVFHHRVKRIVIHVAGRYEIEHVVFVCAEIR